MRYNFKTITFVFACLLTSTSMNAQKLSTKFYNHNWEACDISRARFYSTLEKTDSGWLRNDYFISTKGLQMTALFKDSLCKIHNGTAIYFYANGKPQSIGRYIDDKKEGLYISYHHNGMMADSGNYLNGRLVGVKLGWFPNGEMYDSVLTKNDSVTVRVEWFDNGTPSEYGIYLYNKKHGKWMYFHKNGKPASIEMNDHGKVTEVSYFNEDGTLLQDTALANREATYKNGSKDWSDYLSGKIYWPSEYKLTNTDTANVMTTFTINEDGRVEDYFVSVPYHQLIDRIAIDALKKCPAWKPAIDHNRRVKAYRRQPLTFLQEHE